MRKLTKIEITVFSILFLTGLVSALTFEVNIPQENISTVVTSMINGLVSSISVIIGFAGSLLIFTISRENKRRILSSNRLAFYIFGIAMVLGLFWSVFAYEIVAEFVLAFKIGMMGLLLAIMVLSDIILFYMTRYVE